MSESGEGFNVAATRQNAGSDGAAAVGGAPGNEKAPGPEDSARVTIVSASFNDFSWSQGVRAAAPRGMAAAKQEYSRYRFTWRFLYEQFS